MPVVDQEIERRVVEILKDISGRRTINVDSLIGREVGIYGGDTELLLNDLEREFGVDLEPLIEKYAMATKPGCLGRLMGKTEGPQVFDFTVRILVDFIQLNYLNSNRNAH